MSFSKVPATGPVEPSRRRTQIFRKGPFYVQRKNESRTKGAESTPYIGVQWRTFFRLENRDGTQNKRAISMLFVFILHGVSVAIAFHMPRFVPPSMHIARPNGLFDCILVHWGLMDFPRGGDFGRIGVSHETWGRVILPNA